MTDAHCHVARGASRHFLCDPCDTPSPGVGDVRFAGFHPWFLDGFDADALRARLATDPRLGVAVARPSVSVFFQPAICHFANPIHP